MKKYLKSFPIYIFIFIVASIFTGCSSTRKELQREYRIEGIHAMEAGQYEEALEFFQQALDQSLGKVGEIEMDICFYKAKTQFLLEDVEGALDTYTAIIAYNENPEAYFLRGNMHYYIENEEEAFKDYEKAVENGATDYELYLGIYEVLAHKDRKEEGEKYLKKALDIKGDEAYDKMQKGRIHFLLGDESLAIQLLNEASEEYMESYFYLFQIYDAKGDSDMALRYLNNYMKLEENLDSYKLYDMGTSLMQQKKFENAIECFNKALELEKVPNRQSIMKNLVVSYEKIGNFKEATVVMKKYIELYPDDEEAKREYTFLETR